VKSRPGPRNRLSEGSHQIRVRTPEAEGMHLPQTGRRSEAAAGGLKNCPARNVVGISTRSVWNRGIALEDLLVHEILMRTEPGV